MPTDDEDELADRIFDIIGKHEHDSGTDTWAASKEIAAFFRDETAERDAIIKKCGVALAEKELTIIDQAKQIGALREEAR